MSSAPQLASLVAGAQFGDRRALDVLLRSVQDPLFRHIRALVHDDASASDVLQDSMLTISRRIGTLRDPQWFRAWCYRIATREAIRSVRRAGRAPLHISTEDAGEIAAAEDEALFEPELIRRVPDALKKLSPASRVVLQMHYMEGMTYVEIAEALELNPGTVKSRLAYGLAAMRKLFTQS